MVSVDASGAPTLESPPVSDADLAYGDDGVDVTLIQEMLARTPEERLAALESFVAGLMELRDAVGKPAP